MTTVPHFGFIATAFGVTAVVLAAMIGAILWDYRDLTSRLARMERERGESSR